MIESVLLAVAAATPPNVVPSAVAGLQGCWNAPGQVRGKDAASVARGELRLGGRYLLLHLRSISQQRPYEAALIYGTGERPQSINAYWMDTFGGAYSTAGTGSLSGDGFTVEYRYPDSSYTNRFTRMGKGWRWTITEQSADKPPKLFAEYRLTPVSCRGMTFSF